MPLNRDAYSRYRLIDIRLRKKPYPTLEQLIDYLSENLDKRISKRTVQLDLQEMRYSQALNFSAPIMYDKRERTYRYTDPDFSISNLPVSPDELHGLEFAISILDQFKHLPAIKEFEEAIQRIASTVKINKEARGEADYIQFEKPFVIKGVEYIEPILKAISERRVIKFTYQKHGSDETSENLLEPYLIKEAKNFWYVIGKRTNKKEQKILTFALDRIQNIQLTEETFSEGDIDKKNFFKNVVGVSLGEGQTEKVILAFAPVQGKYIKTVPIHHSQQILKESKSELRIGLEVVINHELKMQLLSYGSNVQVIQPKKLAEEIKETAKQMIKLYA
ncbi:MAG TPA: WYL domain-containing protein [Chitinophagales bacterium]|nr:WYL domain-containing protein [Chitinophagales bacterium]